MNKIERIDGEGCDCPICKEGLKICPNCGSNNLTKGTHREKGKKYSKYFCQDCQHRFIDFKILLNN